MNRREFLRNIGGCIVAIAALIKKAIDENPIEKTTIRIVPIITDYNPDTKIATFD